MQRRNRQLGRNKLARPGHRSHVAGTRRLLSGKKKDAIVDALRADAKAIMQRIRRKRRT